MSDGELLLTAGALLALALASILLAERLRVPGLLLFLGLGMLVGSDVLGWIDFDDAELARTIGVGAVALILFEGGLVSGWRELRPVLVPSLSLAYPRHDHHRGGRGRGGDVDLRPVARGGTPRRAP